MFTISDGATVVVVVVVVIVASPLGYERGYNKD
jgi:hypothetical protein